MSSPEAIYFTSNSEYKKLENLKVTNDIKVLIINNSFSLTLAPFLALHFKEVHMYDLRTRFGGSAEGVIQKSNEIQPDIVLQVQELDSALPLEIIVELKEST